MKDIVQRLREYADQLGAAYPQCDGEMLAEEAAQEIEDYRQALENEKTIGAQRNFVFGAKWWQGHKNGATAFASEVDEMEREAVKRYGLPQRLVPNA